MLGKCRALIGMGYPNQPPLLMIGTIDSRRTKNFDQSKAEYDNKMNPELAGNELSKNENDKKDGADLSTETFASENIFYLGSQIGKSFREGFARIIMDHMVDGIIIFDDSGKIQAFNQVAEEIFFYSPDEVENVPVNKLIPGLDPESFVQFMNSRTDKRKNHGFGNEVTGVCQNGFDISLNLLVKKIDFESCFLFMAIIWEKGQPS